MDISTLVLAFLLVLLIAVLVSIARHRTASGLEKGVWILISLVAPVLGPIRWFAVGSRTVGRSLLG